MRAVRSSRNCLTEFCCTQLYIFLLHNNSKHDLISIKSKIIQAVVYIIFLVSKGQCDEIGCCVCCRLRVFMLHYLFQILICSGALDKSVSLLKKMFHCPIKSHRKCANNTSSKMSHRSPEQPWALLSSLQSVPSLDHSIIILL